MRYLAIFLMFSSLFLSSCGKDIEEEQKSTVEDFFEALKKGDFEAAKEVASPETQELLVVLEEEYKGNKDKIVDPKPIKIDYIRLEGEKTSPQYQVKIIIGEVEKEIIVPLILVQEKWLIFLKPEQISILQFVVFCNQYQLIFVNTDIYIIKSKSHKSYTKSRKKSHKKSHKKSQGKKKGKRR